MADNPHISGKYTIIVALIAALATLGGIYLKHYLENQKEPNTEVINSKPTEDKKEKTEVKSSENENQKENVEDITYAKEKETSEIKKPSTQTFHFFAVLNEDQITSKIIIDGKPAKVVEGHNTVLKKIRIEKLNKEYDFQLIGNGLNCNDSEIIIKNLQKVYLCD